MIFKKKRDFKELLASLREYMYNFYPREPELPLEFWTLDDDLYYDYLNYLPVIFATELGDVSKRNLQPLPEAVHILWPIFSLEEGYDLEGFGKLDDADHEEIELAISAFERVGQPGEAKALRAAMAARSASNGDEDAVENAYLEVKREYEDDGERRMAVINYMRENEDLWGAVAD